MKEKFCILIVVVGSQIHRRGKIAWNYTRMHKHSNEYTQKNTYTNENM